MGRQTDRSIVGALEGAGNPGWGDTPNFRESGPDAKML
jgi:hypothetical protein